MGVCCVDSFYVLCSGRDVCDNSFCDEILVDRFAGDIKKF